MSDNKKRELLISILTALITVVLTICITLACCYLLRPTLTIVFYDTECVKEEIAPNYYEDYVCAHLRLKIEKGHTLQVKDFSIFDNGKWVKATKVEYFDQIVRTSFEIILNQPLLTVYFHVPHSVTDSVVFVKYKDTEMRIGEFVQTR